VLVVFTKWDGSLHWHHAMEYLGEDDHGIWLGARAGSVSQRGSEPPVTMKHAYVGLFALGEPWWVAYFNAAPAPTEIYCDISTPPQWDEDQDEVTMSDLDLDGVRERGSLQTLLVDEDEFAEHQVRYGYPREVIGYAERAAAWLQAAIESGEEPFQRTYQYWLAQVT
jgi:protein associated with RNAse G/E